MRLHPITLALRALRGQRTLHGRPLPTREVAIARLRQWTGQDFGGDPAAWEAWLRMNHAVYSTPMRADAANEELPHTDRGVSE